MCYLSPILPSGCGNHYDNVGQHQDKYLLRDTSALHVTSCVTHDTLWTSQHKYRARTWPESHFRGNLRWQMALSSLSVNIGPWDWVLNTLRWGQWRDDWWRSDQDLDNIDTMIVFSKFITQIKCDGDEDLLRWVTVWQRSSESLSDTFFDLSMTIIVITPVFWLAASLQIIQSDVGIWQVSLLGGNVRERDGWAQNVPSACLLQCAAKPTVRHQSSSRVRKVLDSLSVLELLLLRWKGLIQEDSPAVRCYNEWKLWGKLTFSRQKGRWKC